MKRKLAAIAALAAVAACSFLLGITAVFAVQTAPKLQFTGVYMGGYAWDASGAEDPVTTLWGSGLGLTFATNAYDLGTDGFQKPVQDVVTEVSDGNGGYLTNRQLVTYHSAAGEERSVAVIWYDTQGNLVFRLDNYADASALSDQKDSATGLPYYRYGDGDTVTVKAGFTFPYSDGTAAKKLVLEHDVTVRYDASVNDWSEVAEGAAQINMIKADDVEIVAPAGDYTMWGFVVNLFKNGGRPEPFTEVATNNAPGNVKKAVRTGSGNAMRLFNLNNRYVTYLRANGSVEPITELFYSTMGVCIRPAQETSAKEGEKILLKKGFREAYYYGEQNTDYGVALGWQHFGILQTVGMLSEDVLFVYKDGAWVRANVAPDSVDFIPEIKNLSKIYKGQSINIGVYNLGNVEEMPEFTSSDPSVVSVSDTGVITGGETAGSAVVSVKFTLTTLTLSLENVVTEPVVSGISASVDAEYGAVVLCQGEAGDAASVLGQITVSMIYDNGFPGAGVALTEENVDFTGYDSAKTYDGKAENVQTVTIRVGTAETSVPVHVYSLAKISAPPVGGLHDWGGNINVTFTSLAADTAKGIGFLNDAQLKKLGQYDKVELRSAYFNGDRVYQLNQIGYIYAQQTPLSFAGKAYSELSIGDRLTLKAGFRIYYIDRGAAIALAELTEDFAVVWTGKEWTQYRAEAERLELEYSEITLAVGSYYTVEYALYPAGSYVRAVIRSSDPDTVAVSADGTAISVIAASDEPVTVTVMLGTDESTAKTLLVNAVEMDVVGYRIYEPREYTVSYNGTFRLESYYGSDPVPQKLQAVEVYEDGSTGVPFDLDETNTVIGALDTSVAGTHTVTLTIDKDGAGSDSAPFDTTVTVVVKRSAAQVSSGIMQEPFDQDYAVLYLDFSNTFEGKVNVPEEIVAQYELSSYVRFVRGEKEYPATVKINGEFLVLSPVFDTETGEDARFRLGDRFILSEGMPIIQWTGKDKTYIPEGAGDYVVAGTIEYETVYECNNASLKTWDTLIQYVGIGLESENVELGFGKLKDLGATMIPAYATVGEFTIVSDNPSVVSVNANNLIKGESIGTATLTVTLDGGDNGAIVRTVKVTVVDTRSSIAFDTETVYVKVGTPLTGQVLVEKGVTAQYVWASGKTEGAVDLSSVTVIGYSANQEGEQEVTVRIVVEGTSVTGKIKVVVNETGEAPGGCGSAVAYPFGGLVLVVALAVLFLRKKQFERNRRS